MTEPMPEPDAAPEEVPAEPATEPAEPSEPSEEEQAEEEEGEPAAEPSEPQEPEPAALSEKEIENRLARLAKSAEVWRNRIETIMEADVNVLAPCPLCEPIIPGYIMAGAPLHERRLAV